MQQDAPFQPDWAKSKANRAYGRNFAEICDRLGENLLCCRLSDAMIRLSG